MKVFMVFIFLIYGAYQIIDYYDDRGYCYADGGKYCHEERLHNALIGIIYDIIEKDKRMRKRFLKKQGYTKVDINKTIEKLKSRYDKEQKKILKYCYIDFSKQPYYIDNPKYSKEMDYCSIYNENNDKTHADATILDITYMFDQESVSLFNEIPLVEYERYDGNNTFEKDEEWIGIGINGIRTYSINESCDTDFMGLWGDWSRYY